MADISSIVLPSGTTYYLKDAQARNDISNIQTAIAGGVHFIGSTTTTLTDRSTTNPITISGKSVTALKGDLVACGDSEFLWDGTKWLFFGDFGSLGALAFKDEATGSFTPAGTVAKPTFTGTEETITVTGTPSGSVMIGTGNGTANYTPEGDVSKPTFSGTKATISVSGTTKGSVTIGTGNGTANYTPEGSINITPTVTVNTTTVNSITNVGKLPTCTLPEFSATVANEVLTLSWSEGSYVQGTLPTKGSNQTVATGIKSATATGSFTGTGVQLTASFTGQSMTSTGEYTPAGGVSKPTFTGTGVQITGTFSGSSTTSTGTYKPKGTNSAPKFTGTAGTVTVS